MSKYKVFVINISDERWEKYLSLNDRYIRFKGVVGSELDLEAYDKYVFYWNKNEKAKRSTIGCAESHLSLMRHIISNKLDNVIVIEDDALIDFERLNELDDVKGFCYIGGGFQSTILKNDKSFQKEIIKETYYTQKIHKIDTEKYIITGGHGYYFDTWKTTKEIYDDIKSQKRKRAIDVEFKRIQKKSTLINQFLFPAISTLHLEDAMAGFTYNDKSVYKLNDTNYEY